MPKLDPSNNMMAQQQKIMLYLFPVIFAISGVNFPIGVLIYWSTTNLWTFGQQFYVIKRNPTPGSPAYEELQRKRGATETTPTPTSPEGMTEANRQAEASQAEAARNRQRQQPKKKKPRK
jgi:YidC/Oxa1 family membrane protein insertase